MFKWIKIKHFLEELILSIFIIIDLAMATTFVYIVYSTIQFIYRAFFNIH
jgi:hypothetical protein